MRSDATLLAEQIKLSVKPCFILEYRYIHHSKATSTSAGKLIDADAEFQSWGVAEGWTVFNRTTLGNTTVVSVDSQIQLTLTDDIMISGNYYSVSNDWERLDNLGEANRIARVNFAGEPSNSTFAIMLKNSDGAYDSFNGGGG